MGILLAGSSLYNLLTRDSVPAGEPFHFKKLLFLAFASAPVPHRTSLRTYSVTCFVYVFIGRRVLRAEERIPGHVQRLIFGNDRVQVAQQGEVFGLDDPARGELEQGAPDDHDRCRALQRDPGHALAYLREGQPGTHHPPPPHVAPTLPPPVP